MVGTHGKVDLAGDQDPSFEVREGGEDEHLVCASNPTAPDETICLVPLD